MSETTLSAEQIASAIAHMNKDHQESLLAYARVLADAEWAQSVTLTALDAAGFELEVADGNGRFETRHISFPQPVNDIGELRMAFIQLAAQAPAGEAGTRTATAHVETAKASRYLKALCNHFSRKVEASYDDRNGRVTFPFGDCELEAQDDALLLKVVAESETMFARLKSVVADHLVRFGNKEELQVNWVDRK